MNWAILAAALLALLCAPVAAQEAAPPSAESTAEEDFDLDAIAATVRDAPPSPVGAAVPELRNSRSVDDRIGTLMRRYMELCWQRPDEPSTVVTLTFDLNPDGTLDGQPRVTQPHGYAFDPSARRAADAARAAIESCAPFAFAIDPVTRDHYDRWRQMELVFDPRN
jgi:hypothetical protein